VYKPDPKANLPWSEKYRPDKISRVIYHDKITKAIINYMDNNKLPHLLFYGPPGTGKTTTIIAVAKHYYKEDFNNMILVLNASEERGIETVRNRIKQFVITKGIVENPLTPSFKLIILDEIDAMTEDAQAILRKVIEKYVSNVRFCFICNYLKKINPAIQSRCVIFRFNPIPYEHMYDFVVEICKKENMRITSNAIKLIIKKSNGDMRKLLNILQSVNMYLNTNQSQSKSQSKNQSQSKSKSQDILYVSDINTNSETTSKINELEDINDIIINETSISKILSCPTHKHINDILNYIQNHNLKKSYNYIGELLIENGISLMELINYIYEYCIDYITNDNDQIIKYPLEKVVKIMKHLCLINENLTYCNNDNIQLISFLSVFYL
jgi:DNA polymerase III delta prime subunit